jgi:hypothetical protein
MLNVSPAPLRYPEIDMREFGNVYFHGFVKQSLWEKGCVLLRNAMAPERCVFYRVMLEQAHENLERLVNGKGLRVEESDESYNHKGDDHALTYSLKLGQIPDCVFASENPGFSIFDLIGDIRFGLMLMKFFGKEYFPSPYAHTRRVSPHEQDKSNRFHPGLYVHMDAQFHTPQQFGLNFWTPLVPCGADAPGLQVVMCELPEILDFVRFDRSDGSFSEQQVAKINDDALACFGAERLFVPVMNLGDVLLIHSWTMHGTYISPGMSRPRISCELRVNYDDPCFPE